jgi:predicted dehydrogenase
MSVKLFILEQTIAMTTRRSFLQTLSAPVWALPFVSSIAEREYQEGKVLRVALIGLGSYASRVAEAMKDSKRAVVAGLVSGTPSKLVSWRAKYNVSESNCYNYETVDQIKNNADIDAVYIITPNALHKDMAIRMAKAGKHVIVEKPMALNAKEAKEMVDACKKARVQLLVGYRMHFEPKTLEIIRMRNDGEFGQVKFFQGLCGFRIGDPKQWRLNKSLAGGGSMMDIGIYAVNGARYMIGEEPAWVTAQETKTDFVKFAEGVDETIQFQLGFPSGAVASCLSTYSMNNLDRFFLNGDKGFAELQPSTGYGPIKGRTNKGELQHPHITHQTIQMDEFAAIILDGKIPVVPADGHEGLRDMLVIDAIYTAVKSGKRISL